MNTPFECSREVRNELLALAVHLDYLPKEQFDMGMGNSCSAAWGNFIHSGLHDYFPFARRVIGSTINPAYYFLFVSSWDCADNTPKGAAKRIRYLLKNGCPTIEDVDKMLGGAVPLCY